MAERIRASIVGASGYVGGELLRLLLDHPHVEVGQVTSERNAGAFVHFTHPNLRGRTKLQFVSAAELEACDLLFLGLPHGGAMGRIEEFAAVGPAHCRSERRLSAARELRTMTAGMARRTPIQRGLPSLSMACRSCIARH